MVKCAECGFLTVRQHFERTLSEVEDGIRKGGEWPVQRGTNISLYEKRPLCFMMAQKIGDKDSDYAAYEFKEVVNEDKDCQEYTPWKQGFTPKEHREMLDRQEFREWQERQRNADRRWRIIEIVMLAILSGVFVVLGALIGRGSIP